MKNTIKKHQEAADLIKNSNNNSFHSKSRKAIKSKQLTETLLKEIKKANFPELDGE